MPDKIPDDLDLHNAGLLSDDPEADAVPMLTAAQKDAAVMYAERVRSIDMLLPAAFERMKARAAGLEAPTPTPWESVNDATGGGWWPGLHVLVGNPGDGKTQWAVQAALGAAQSGVPVLYICLELAAETVAARMFGLLTGQEWSKLWRGSVTAANLAELEGSNAAELLARLPIDVAEAPPYGFPYQDLEPLARAFIHNAPKPDGPRTVANPDRPPLVVLDYLQVVADKPNGDGYGLELRERIQQASYAGRQVAKEYGAAVLLVSSTARTQYEHLRLEAGKDPPPAPTLIGTGKESGEIEFAADSVLVLVREAWAGDKPPDGGTRMHLAVAKQREGPPAWCKLRFDGTRYSDGRDDREPDVPDDRTADAPFGADAF